MSKILVIDSCWKCSNKDIAIEDYSEYTCLLLNKKILDDKITKEILKDCPLKDAYEEQGKGNVQDSNNR